MPPRENGSANSIAARTVEPGRHAIAGDEDLHVAAHVHVASKASLEARPVGAVQFEDGLTLDALLGIIRY
jgi:hypothetical protein